MKNGPAAGPEMRRPPRVFPHLDVASSLRDPDQPKKEKT
jgi:hypothetical protein